MARLLAYTSASAGHVYPAAGILVELRDRGHEVHVRTRQEDVGRLGSLGLLAEPIDPRIEAIDFDDWRAGSQAKAMRRIIELYDEFAELELPDAQRAIDEVRPDVVIMDVQVEGGLCAAEASGLPFATFCPYPVPIPSRDAPPHGLGLAPASGPLGRARDRLVHLYGRRALAPHVAKRNELRARVGLAPMRDYEEQWLAADRFIALTAEPYEYPRGDWPPSVRLVGPVTWDPPAEPPAWLASETRPIMLVSASTAYQNDGLLVSTALEALAGEAVAVIATTAANDPAPFAAPPNARVEAFVPHGPIIERAACVVCHGGQGTTQKALAAGVPVCVVPFYRDQFDVARRVEVAEAGVRLHHKRLAPQRLRAAVRAATTKRPGAERIARAFAAAGGARAAADAVEELVTAPADRASRHVAAPG